MANIIVPPNNLTAAQRAARPSLYLAGPFNPGEWRDEVLRAITDLDVDVFDPRNGIWETPAADTLAAGAFNGMLSWQLTNAEKATAVVFWLPRDIAAPTAMLQLGQLAAKRGGAKRGSTVIVGPQGGKTDLIRSFAAAAQVFNMPDLEGVIRAARRQLAGG